MFNSWFTKFSSQPHQPFFVSGIVFFVLFMFLLFANYSNIYTLESSISVFHAYPMIFLVFTQFFLGFLYTVFPRFLMGTPIPSKTYMQNFYLFLLSSVLILLSIVFSLSILFVSLLLVFAQVMACKNLYEVHKKSPHLNKTDTKWILIAFISGIVGNVLFLISLFDFPYSNVLQNFAINIGFYLFLFGVIFAVSQRMIPFFTSAKVKDYKINKSANLLPLVFSLLALKVVLLTIDIKELQLLSDIPLFFVLMKELIKWNLPFKKSPPILWILFISLYWIPISLLLSIFESFNALLNTGIIFEKASIHALSIGYFVTVLLGFGTRVTLGHSGQTPHANNFTIAIFMAVQFITLLRVFTSFSLNFSDQYILLLNITSILLILGLIAWSSKYLKILISGK